MTTLSGDTHMALVRPSREYLSSYTAALERGWSPDNVRGIEATRRSFSGLPPTPTRSSPAWTTARRRDHRSRCPTAPTSRDFPDGGAGCGTTSSPGTSDFGGSPAHPHSQRIASGTSATRWCRAKQGRGYATRALDACSPRGAGRGPRLRGDHAPTPTTSRRNESSKPTVAGSSNGSPSFPHTGARPACATVST